MEKHLITAKMVACLDSADHIYDDGYLIIADGRIVEIGYQRDLADKAGFAAVTDLGNRLIMPGLVNAHTHSPMTLFRGHVDRKSVV